MTTRPHSRIAPSFELAKGGANRNPEIETRLHRDASTVPWEFLTRSFEFRMPSAIPSQKIQDDADKRASRHADEQEPASRGYSNQKDEKKSNNENEPRRTLQRDFVGYHGRPLFPTFPNAIIAEA